MSVKRRLLLVILDGFGLSPATNGNAIFQAKTPVLDQLVSQYPYTALKAHGTEVGLGWGEMGNSEVGHLNIGAGRVVVQDVTRIARSIQDRTFFRNAALVGACESVKKLGGTLHCIGIASPGGVHGHVQYLEALLELASQQQVKKVALHLIADGRDAEPTSIGKYLPRIEAARQKFGGQYATLTGRYWAMDRDRHWDRTKAAYEAIVLGQGAKAKTINEAIEAAYTRKESDEFIKPTILSPGGEDFSVTPADAVIFANHRPDRARQLARALAGKDFDDFTRVGPVSHLTTFTNYGVALQNTGVAFQTEPITDQLADVLDEAGLRQFHVAETEKYAHVTYFFNGYVEQPFTQEHRQLIQSPKVETYDQAPAMSAQKLTDVLLEAYQADSFEFGVVNFANPDMVGHTGNLAATVEAVEVVDTQLGRIAQAVIDRGDILCLTADHGNAEQLIHPDTGDIDKEHTANPVPFLVVHPGWKHTMQPERAKLTFLAKAPIGILGDVAPTLLDLLGIRVPILMTGRSLIGELRRGQ